MTTLPAPELAAAMRAAERVVEARNTIPILSMVRLVSTKDGLEITTTNLDIQYRQTIACKGTEFALCVDAKRLGQMASAAKANITLEPGKGNLTVKSGRSRWTMPALPVDDFPSMPVDKLCKPIAIDHEALARVLWALSNEETRYYLCGVFLNDEGGAARYVTTQGHKLASMQTATKWPKDAPDVIVPTGLVKVIIAMDGGQAAWDDKKMQVINGDVTVTGKMIEGTFPPYRRVIPEVSSVVQVDAGALLAEVNSAKIASDAKERELILTPGDNELVLRIKGTSGFGGEGAVDTNGDRDFVTSVNADYFAEVLNACGDGIVRISQEHAKAAMRFDPANDPDFIGVMTPFL